MCKRLVLVLSLILLAQPFLERCGVASEDLLTIDDVEKVAGVHGLKLVPKNSQIGAGGNLNFTLEDDTLVLMATIQDSSTYEQWKGQEDFFLPQYRELEMRHLKAPVLVSFVIFLCSE